MGQYPTVEHERLVREKKRDGIALGVWLVVWLVVWGVLVWTLMDTANRWQAELLGDGQRYSAKLTGACLLFVALGPALVAQRIASWILRRQGGA